MIGRLGNAMEQLAAARKSGSLNVDSERANALMSVSVREEIHHHCQFRCDLLWSIPVESRAKPEAIRTIPDDSRPKRSLSQDKTSQWLS